MDGRLDLFAIIQTSLLVSLDAMGAAHTRQTKDVMALAVRCNDRDSATGLGGQIDLADKLMNRLSDRPALPLQDGDDAQGGHAGLEAQVTKKDPRLAWRRVLRVLKALRRFYGHAPSFI